MWAILNIFLHWFCTKLPFSIHYYSIHCQFTICGNSYSLSSVSKPCSLVYNSDIRQKMIGCIKMRNKCKKLIVFREWSQYKHCIATNCQNKTLYLLCTYVNCDYMYVCLCTYFILLYTYVILQYYTVIWLVIFMWKTFAIKCFVSWVSLMKDF